MGLLQPDGITTADLATLQHGGIDASVGLVVLGYRSQDTRILREIALREGGHHAAGARTSDAQANGIPDREDVPDPSILHEILLVVRGLHHDVWPKPPHLEAPLWIQHPQPIERG